MSKASLHRAALDRCAGVLVGLAAGDALGAGYEFGVPPRGDPQMIGGGLGPWEPGEWTDDTQMSLCVAEVAATGVLDAEAVGERFLSWYREPPKDVGNQTRAVLSGARSAGDLTRLAAQHFRAHPNSSAGNGSLMRTAPVALAHLGDDQAIAEAAWAVSGLTHADPQTGEACVLWCIAIDRAVREGRLDGVHDGLALLAVDRRGRWEALLHQAENKSPSAFNPNGYVVAAFQAAHAAISQTPIPDRQPCRHLQAALANAVRVGHDTDTVAAIAGGLLGARWGASAVPAAWRSLIHGWPGYRSADLVRLAVLSARGGNDDDAGWPSASSLLPYYKERFHPRETLIAIDDDPALWLGDVTRLRELPAEVGAVLSLCPLGQDDIPPDLDRNDAAVLDDREGSASPNLDFILSDLVDQVTAWRRDGRGVFIHGVTVDGAVTALAAAYLASHQGLGGKQALRQLTTRVPGPEPSSRLVEALGRLWPDTGASA